MEEEADELEQFLFVVEYGSDAERKRAEYLFDNAEGDVNTLDGLSRVVSELDQQELYEQLVSKVPEEQVSAFRLAPLEVETEPEIKIVEQRITATSEVVESFIEYIFSKKKAVLQAPTRNKYEVYTKKGRAEVTYDLEEKDESTSVQIRIEGYPPAPNFLANFFSSELSEYANSQQS